MHEDIFEAVARLRASGGRGVLATVIGTRGSTPGRETMRLLVHEDGSFVGSVGGGCVEAEVVGEALEVLAEDRPRRGTFRLTERETGAEGLACGGELEVFFEPVTAPGLVLFGAGHVAKDLCEMAARAGFRVTVVDDREEFANAERFPAARRVLARPSFAQAFQELEVTAATCCVVVTRGHAMDLACLDHALHTPAPYVGLIGSRRKIGAILARLTDAGRLEGVDLARLHAPIGLDVGAVTHGEIAVAVAAELVAFRRHVLGGLRAKRLAGEELARLVERRAGGRRATRAGAPPALDADV
ncbi:MAG TPA: XdhC/CoxI family protein [Gemmatimonadales bacterium]|nr:XdhC/CoxI family protein [Gemmatimonadales bacterium]